MKIGSQILSFIIIIIIIIIIECYILCNLIQEKPFFLTTNNWLFLHPHECQKKSFLYILWNLFR